MNSSLDKVRNFCNTQGLNLSSGHPIYVGLSGGADSVALLLILRELGADVRALHCNFHLRGAESNRDMEFCLNLCESHDIPLEIKHFDVKEYQLAEGGSVEMACRELRYAWWNSFGADIAVGHHRDDNVETLFLNLLRGSGLAGLKGMLPRNGHIIRPLLCLSRGEIEDYLSAHNQPFVTDSTNLLSDYKRNKLRNIIIPALEREFPGAVDAISRSIDCLRGNWLVYEQDTELNRTLAHSSVTGHINIGAIINPSAPFELNSTRVHEVVSELGFSSRQTADITDCALRGAWGSRFIAGDTEYVLSQGMLKPVSDAVITPHTVNLSESPFSLSPIDPLIFDGLKRNHALYNPYVAYFDRRILDGDPVFELRTWREGDKFHPFGLKGTKLLSDLFTDLKVSAAERPFVPVLTRNDKIIWAVGLRASDDFRVTADTRQIIEITYQR